MAKSATRKEARARRHLRVRQKVSGTAEVPRMSVFISGKHIYIQFIDDVSGQTLASASSQSQLFRESGKRADMAGAPVLGRLAAESALAKDIRKVVFDRGGFKYHGRVKAIADAAREAGLKL